MKTDPPYNVFERIAGDLLRFHMSRTTDFQQRDGSGNAPRNSPTNSATEATAEWPERIDQ